MKRILLTVVLTTLAWSVAGQTKHLVNVDRSGLALRGYDPVAFFTENKPVKGQPAFQSSHAGASYRFASPANKARFDKEPDKYAPAFGGFCAYGVSRNKLVGVDLEAFQIVEGRLLLQYSKGVRNDFNKDPQGNLVRADQNWPGLVAQKGK